MSITPPAAVSVDDPLFDECYRAMVSRDQRFDGQFISGVHSTGIYCRPSCSALTPKPTNVTFYRTAAAAHEAGLRACKRCQPDAVPGSPEWNLHDDLASRAMRLIADGTLEREGVSGLAHRLGFTPRHVGRVLVSELGAGPLALARAHRAQTARTLLTATDLTIGDVAFAAGFASIRQFNETVRAVYEQTPTALRARRTALPPTAGPTPITLRLPARAPFDGPRLMRFFADHAIEGVEAGNDRSFSRLVRLPGGIARVALELDGPTTVSCRASVASLSDLPTLVARVRRLLDLDADPQAIDGALREDEVLAPLIALRAGMRLPGTLDAEEAVFRTMIGQQISVASATTVLGRIATELGEGPGLFPTASTIAEHGHEVLRGPAARVTSIIAVATAIARGDISLDVGMPTADLIAELTALRGIGPWTAGYIAMRVLGNPDVLLTTDLVMLHSASRLGLPANARALAEYGARWAPWRSYAGLHLWAAR